ncbi:MAG: ABC transporter substrate-binding protein [Chloroflexi bacterium]|nr:ABC transporter substrate-binding protein [Chloroflexota bacterium]
MTYITRRRALRWLAAGAGMSLLAACGPSAPAAPATPLGGGTSTGAPTTAQAAATGSGQPKPGGTLRMGMVGDLTQLEGQLIIPGALDTLWQVYDRLTAYDDKMQPQPMLAESWELTPDGKQITLHLRQGVQFHSGRQLTSADIQANITRAQNPKTGVGQLAPLASWWTEVRTPDLSTVVLVSDQPRPGVFDFFEYFNIVDPVAAAAPDAATKPIGTGPFMLTDYAQGDHITFKKNPNYWQTGKPYLDGFVATILRDQQAMSAQLEGGALDVVDAPGTPDAARLKTDPKYQFIVDPASGTYGLVAANAQLAPTDNKLVRQAINWTINRQRYAETVLQGLYGTPKDLPWPSSSAANDPAKQALYHQDLDKARALIQQAGAAGAALTILHTAGNSEQANLAQILQADLQSIGVQTTINGQDPATWRATTASLKGWHINLASSDYSQLLPSSLATMSAWWSYSVGQTGFKDPQYEQLVATIGTEPDTAKRTALYGQLNDYLLDQSFAMVLSPSPSRMLARANVQGIRFHHHEAVDFSSTWLA